MDIRDALIQAKKEGRGITRKSYGQFQLPYMLLPTNSILCVFIILFEDDHLWNPKLDDLIADDWYVCG